FWVSFVTVEEMLAVEQNFPALRLGSAYAVADRGKIFLFGRLQSNFDVVVPGLCDKANRVGLCFKERRKTRVIGSRTARAARHAKGGERRIELTILAEQLGISRVCAWKTALDVVYAEFVQHARDHQLIGEREVNAVRLRAVAQCGVKKVQAFLRHHALHQR